MIAPGAVLGVLGSGQLGRMFTIAARRMGYRVHTFSPDSDTPTGQVADVEVVASYDDADALRAFAGKVSVVTFEFENVPSAATEVLASMVPVRPSPLALHVAQQRAREKRFLAAHGIPTVPFEVATAAAELTTALERIGTPADRQDRRVRLRRQGSAGRTAASDGARIWTALGGGELVVEKRISLQAELSVIAARGVDGAGGAVSLVREPPPAITSSTSPPLPRSCRRRSPRRPPRSGGRCWRRWTTWACCASSSSSAPTAC